jgi:hypothetical protein
MGGRRRTPHQNPLVAVIESVVRIECRPLSTSY